ncbi:hypothetical protein [Azospirillum isscasi]|uniref:SAM-dependent methyltransferase n=1 Tax=Azospirillum isscasi TaxID=3053926 RepID=A0ABU0WLT0_9PROT|nr:hypothetical protein [Azospirillum isscasi]MDQ2104524.1 hypothetical protein [Azospirillum isscasi]
MIDFLFAQQPLAELILVNAILAYSQYIALRAGVFSLATAGLASLGAYTAAVLTVRWGVPMPLGLAAAALRPGGRLAFTVERLEEGGAPCRVSPHGRYAHTEGHVRECLAAAGLTVRRLAPDTLRHESGAPVAGLVVVAARP